MFIVNGLSDFIFDALFVTYSVLGCLIAARPFRALDLFGPVISCVFFLFLFCFSPKKFYYRPFLC